MASTSDTTYDYDPMIYGVMRECATRLGGEFVYPSMHTSDRAQREAFKAADRGVQEEVHMATTDLDMSDSYGLYAGVPRRKFTGGTAFLGTPQKVIDTVTKAMTDKESDSAAWPENQASTRTHWNGCCAQASLPWATPSRSSRPWASAPRGFQTPM